MSRPEHLPDFQSPPLNEVVLGVQFKPPKGYQQIRAREVWELFSSEFPIVQELQAIPPAFETFGLPQSGAQLNFGIVTGATHDRFWFLAQNQEELLQFQHDRLLHNWRKIGDQTSYPRFERMIERFEAELVRLENYFLKNWQQKLLINQCEISYINHIGGNENLKIQPASNWLRFVNFLDREPDDFSVTFREIIRTENGQFRGRLICEASTGFDKANKQIIVLTITARGAPSRPDIAAALEFLRMGRERVVARFAALTTELAHRTWKRVS